LLASGADKDQLDTFTLYIGQRDQPPLVLVENGGTGVRHFLHAAWDGSVIAVTNQAGELSEAYRYSAYGETTVLGPDGKTPIGQTAVGNRFQYQGRWREAQLPLYDMGAREYKPTWGRFLSPDPIGLGGGQNLYAFADSSPLHLADVTGLSTVQQNPTVQAPQVTAPDPDRSAFDKQHPFFWFQWARDIYDQVEHGTRSEFAWGLTRIIAMAPFVLAEKLFVEPTLVPWMEADQLEGQANARDWINTLTHTRELYNPEREAAFRQRFIGAINLGLTLGAFGPAPAGALLARTGKFGAVQQVLSRWAQRDAADALTISRAVGDVTAENFRTVAVTTFPGSIRVATSSYPLAPAQVATARRLGIIPIQSAVRGQGIHAEPHAIEIGLSLGLTGRISASKPICPGCQADMVQFGFKAGSALK
jgi:RHS repeat-associated protein